MVCLVQKFTDLIDLYKGKKMHEKALKLIHEYAITPKHSGLELISVIHGRLSLDEDDVRDKLEPAVRYLQRLGPEYLPLIFENARWVLDVDRNMGLQVRRSTGTCWWVSD